ncbi:phage portal protein family protein [Mucilaginibacter lappiensis]|uniref:Mu-like prophage protein gp29 n=1 Tax=Mucilaginibacter lappiensis TaxID=354630 RepID=A0A841JU36_9SPHI|nr:DUF935 family protein [Mucilaginibacter lappiensis]MBB6131341.1 hypothetical protein [Mucilaginibacter lappiensis]
MQKTTNTKASAQATKKGPLSGLKHGGTITLKDGTTFTKAQIKNDPGMVMAAIVKQQRSLYSKAMEDWIAARAMAENPDYPIRTLLYDIYDDIILDNFISGLIYNHRILPVKNKPIKIINAKKEFDQVKTDLFTKGWVRELFKWWLESIFYGFSLPYIDELLFDGKTAWINKLILLPRKNVNPELKVVTRFQSDFEGFDFCEDPLKKYVFPAGDRYDLGLLNKATPMAILKKHGWQNWDEFAEIFGMPIRTVKTASQDQRVLGEIEGWLRDMSTSSYGIFPAGTELDIKESKQSDAFNVFAQLIKAANEELAILICGQTMTSMNGSSRSQGEVHERVMDQITKDDELFVKTLFNETLIPILRDVHGWPLDEGDTMEWDHPEDLQALLKIFTGVNAMGFQIDPKQVEEKFGTKIIGLKLPAAPPDPKDDKPEDPQKEDKEMSAEQLLQLHAKLQKLYYGGLANV